MENFKKRNEKIKIENKIKYNKLNTDEEIRHENNLLKLNEENEKNMIKNKEKTFKKFCSFYWIRKNKVLEHIKKRKELKDKLMEKAEKMIKFEKMNDIKRTNILKKIKTMNERKKAKEKKKLEKILDSKREREKRFTSCEKRRKEFLLEESERRKDILYYQSQILARSLSRDNIFLMKKNNAHEKRSQEQIILEKNLFNFTKKMNMLKSQSIYKKSFEERLKLFKEIKRKEAEKRKEMEEKLNK